MAAPPEPILKGLERLGIPYQISKLPFADDDEYDCIVIRVQDMEEGERRHQDAGSLYKQVYGEDSPLAPQRVSQVEQFDLENAFKNLATDGNT